MIILVVIFGRNKEKEQNKSFDFPQIQPPIPIEDTTPPTEDTTPPQKQHFSWANKGILLVVGVIVVVALIGSAVYLGGFNKSSHGEIWVRAQDDESVITIVAKTNSVEVKVTTPQDDGPSITYYHGTIPPNQARDIPRRQALIIESKQYENIRLIIDGRTWDMPTSVIYIKK